MLGFDFGSILLGQYLYWDYTINPFLPWVVFKEAKTDYFNKLILGSE